jgi:hypothetical protein
VSCNFLRNAYRQIFPVHTDPSEQTMEMAPVLQMGRIDIPGAVEEEFNDWYNTVYIPTYLTVPGVLRARRFAAIEGQPKYLTLYELQHAQVPESEAWSKARASNPWTRRMSPNLVTMSARRASTGASSRSNTSWCYTESEAHFPSVYTCALARVDGTSSASMWTGTRVPRNAGFPPMILPIYRSLVGARVERISSARAPEMCPF